MRKNYTRALNTLFHKTVFQCRVALEISQEEMATRLAMAGRSYIDLEHGVKGCSALTLALFLVFICSDPVNFLEELRNVFEEENTNAA